MKWSDYRLYHLKHELMTNHNMKKIKKEQMQNFEMELKFKFQ